MLRLYVDIGTKPGGSDVVINGVPRMAYNVKVHTAVIGANVDVATFYVSMSQGIYACTR